jgi:hypothetical protein
MPPHPSIMWLGIPLMARLMTSHFETAIAQRGPPMRFAGEGAVGCYTCRYTRLKSHR